MGRPPLAPGNANLGAGSEDELCAPSSKTGQLLNDSANVMRELRDTADEEIREDLLNNGRCALAMKKTAFVLGGEYGTGVLSCRQANAWRPPVHAAGQGS
jgi:lipid-binding SYLF domain-containing protein